MDPRKGAGFLDARVGYRQASKETTRETIMQRRAILAIVAFATSYGCRAEKGSVPEEPIGEAGASGAPAMATLEVRVLASEQPTWPSSVMVSVTLEDSAKTDVAAEKVAEQSIRAAGAPPYSVTLTYDPSHLNPQGRYGVRARIEEGDHLLFESVYFTPAFERTGLPGTPPSEPIDLVVQRVAEEVGPASVSSGEAKSELAASPGEAETVVPGLLDKRWKLRTLNGKTGLTRGDDRASFITLFQDGHEFRGNIGCVRIGGRYKLEGDRLRFPVVFKSKQGPCTVEKKLERGFQNVLRHARRYELSKNKLTLLADDGRALATFRPEL
jgi:uncharacterized lipoprotein YbaY/heat shock protein HslJ